MTILDQLRIAVRYETRSVTRHDRDKWRLRRQQLLRDLWPDQTSPEKELANDTGIGCNGSSDCADTVLLRCADTVLLRKGRP